ncbi:hypothetical protein BCV69DRAFT_281382 [Microstroma glucosiphilum]|uniref:Uncharacterized protein n=1 Tax=Pseudomicrostroma glucosiphilum TaxID=1684307 RepID=A0A316UAY0_9BASI|nr:hypothetical protein BCV69DRAFT_281382 [Pseudomicrostroma glucosiphilum]PWN22380.1 hypothetical protein BCV69DRAFT_281382 [Pseudomicrostroma glucosiphilum]
MSGGRSSNMLPKNDSPAHKSVAEFVRAGGARDRFTFDGNRGEQQAKLCRILPDGRQQCMDVALESKDLFAAMQSLNFFCQLPQDPAKTHINCEPIPQ